MCRLALKTANDPFSPYEVLEAMEAMQEGYDGSGLGLLLRGMEFEDFKYNPRFPILSGIAENKKSLEAAGPVHGGTRLRAEVRSQVQHAAPAI